MKKLLFLGLLSLAGVCASVRDADAWFLGCCRDWCCNRCTTTLCVRPYNAFSPVAYGNICADGCMPINVFGGCCPPRQMPQGYGYPGYGQGYGCPSYGPGCCISGMSDFGCLPAPGAVAGAPQAPAQIPVIPGQPLPQNGPSPQFAPPNPQIVNPGAYTMPMQTPPGYGYGYPNVQPIGYYPSYQPMYNPYARAPMPMPMPMNPYAAYGQFQAPSYWYGR